MATRSRGPSTRAPKAPPSAGDALGEQKRSPQENKGKPSETARSSVRTASNAEITGGRLERREIPSFSEDRQQRIAEAAYWRAERRGFEPGRELDDWLEAEREVDGQRRADPSLNQRPDGRTG